MSRATRTCFATLALLTACSTDPPRWRQTVTGLVSFQSDGVAQLAECGSKRTMLVGSMGRGSYLELRRRVGELSAGGRKLVTAEVSGYIEHTGGTRVVERPAIVGLATGRCVEIRDLGYRD